MATRLFTAAAMLAVALFALTSLQSPAQAKHHKKGEGHDKPREVEIKTPPINVAPKGWTALFNGKDIKGWVKKSGTATYEVKDGIITGTTVKGSPNTFLCTPKEYGDFELKFDVLLHDNQLNSGCQIRSQLKGDLKKYGGRLSGPQVEIMRSPGKSGYIYGEALGTGWLSPEPKGKDKSKRSHKHFKNGKWNQYHIIAKGNNIKTYINGTLIADLAVPEKVQKTYSKGVIGLQVHSVGGDPKWKVSWRNIYLKELKGE